MSRVAHTIMPLPGTPMNLRISALRASQWATTSSLSWRTRSGAP